MALLDAAVLYDAGQWSIECWTLSYTTQGSLFEIMYCMVCYILCCMRQCGSSAVRWVVNKLSYITVIHYCHKVHMSNIIVIQYMRHTLLSYSTYAARCCTLPGLYSEVQFLRPSSGVAQRYHRPAWTVPMSAKSVNIYHTENAMCIIVTYHQHKPICTLYNM